MNGKQDAARNPRQLSKRLRTLTIAVSWLTIVASVWIFLPLFGVQVSRLTLAVVAILTAVVLFLFLRIRPQASLQFFRYIRTGAIRLYFMLRGSPKRNFWGDFARSFGVIGVTLSALKFYRTNGLPVHYSLLFFSSVLCLLYHAVIHPVVKARPWQTDYKIRKLNLAVALSDAAVCAKDDKATHHRIESMELNALSAIKSYLEFTIPDSERSNLNVNLIVQDPNDKTKLVCIQRAVKGKEVPKWYGEDELKAARRALETGKVHYNGTYHREGKDYRMIWVVPIPSPSSKDNLNLGLLAVDSRKRRHLDMRDDRESLQKNLSPYLAVLGLSLVLRGRHKIWDELQ
jgi:hypothetical protein